MSTCDVPAKLDRRIPVESYRRILRLIASGESIRSAAARLRKEGLRVPTAPGFLYWCDRSPERSERYARAMRIRQRLRMDTLSELARRAGKINGVDCTDPAMLNALVQRARLQIDVEKWAASKLDSRVYGDKLQHEHSGSVSITVDTGLPHTHSRIGYESIGNEPMRLLDDATDAVVVLGTGDAAQRAAALGMLDD